jgi:hypothetical protein
MVWIILLLRRGGLDAESIPVFLDHGNLLAASRILQNDHGVAFSIKFCLERLIRNVVSKFSLSKAAAGSLRHIMAQMQSSSTIDTFVAETHRMMAMLDCSLAAKSPLACCRCIQLIGQSLAIGKAN